MKKEKRKNKTEKGEKVRKGWEKVGTREEHGRNKEGTRRGTGRNKGKQQRGGTKGGKKGERTKGLQRGVLCCLHRMGVCAGNCLLSVSPVCCAWSNAVRQCASEGTRLPTLKGDTPTEAAPRTPVLRPFSMHHTVRSRGFLLSSL